MRLIDAEYLIEHVRACMENERLMKTATEDEILRMIEDVPSAQKKGYTKADYIMALHKEYGCSLARAEEAHQKSLEYLRNTSMIKG